jgi:hypothetical protein
MDSKTYYVRDIGFQRAIGAKKMKKKLFPIKEIDQIITEMEGGKKSLSIAQIKEVRKIVSVMLYWDTQISSPEVYKALVANGKRIVAREKKGHTTLKKLMNAYKNLIKRHKS